MNYPERPYAPPKFAPLPPSELRERKRMLFEQVQEQGVTKDNLLATLNLTGETVYLVETLLERLNNEHARRNRTG